MNIILPSRFMKKSLYGINVDFRKEFQKEIKKQINVQIENSWSFNDPMDMWYYDFDSPELKGHTYPKEMAKFLISSVELEKEFEVYNTSQMWYQLNSLSKIKLQKRIGDLRKDLTSIGSSYYKELNQMPTNLSSMCEDEMGNLVSKRKVLAQLFLTSPFYNDKNPTDTTGGIVKFGLIYNLALILSVLGILSFKKPAESLTWIVLKSKSYKKKKTAFFKGLRELSEQMVLGEDGKKNVPSLNLFFGEGVFKKLRLEIKNLSELRTKAAPVYIEYLLSQYALYDMVPSTISFGKDGKMSTFLPKPKLFLKRNVLTEYENEILSGEHDKHSAHKKSFVLTHLLEWMDENKFFPGMESDVIHYIRSQFKKYIEICTPRTVRNKLKVIAQVETKPEMEKYLWNLYLRIQKGSERFGK